MATHVKSRAINAAHPVSNGATAVAALVLIVLAATVVIGAGGCDPKQAWTPIGGDQITVNVNDICLAYDSARDVLYAGTEGHGVWRCTGASTNPHWSEAGSKRIPVVMSIAYDPAHDILYASGGMKDTVFSDFNGGIWRLAGPATKAGWVDTKSPSAASALAYDRSQNALYAAMDGVWRCSSPDSAARWSDAGGELRKISTGSLIFDDASKTLYGGTTGVLYASTLEADLHWHNITTTLNSPEDFNGTFASSLAYDSKRDVLYVGTPGIGVRRCINPRGARSWVSIGDNLINKNGPNGVSGLGFDTARNILYIGGFEAGGTLGPSPPGGVWRCTRPDTDAVWSNTGGPIYRSEMAAIVYDPARGVLFAVGGLAGAIKSQGFWRYEPLTPK